MAAAAAPMALIGVGLSATSSLMKGIGESSADQYMADRLERAAQIGRVKAEQTGAQMTEKLNDTLGNIDAVRAAAHADPTSPTGAAIRQTAEDRGVRQKDIAVENIMLQVEQDEADAAYERSASQFALLGGFVNAGASLATGFGKRG